MKKALTYFVITATLLSLVVPVASLRAQSCDPDALQKIRNVAHQKLVYGKRSADIKNLQLCLMELEYKIPAGATGYYHNQTKAAVIQFYRDHLGVSWHGNWFGPKAVDSLVSALVAQVPEEKEQVAEEKEEAAKPQISVELFAQALQKAKEGDTLGAFVLLLKAIGVEIPSELISALQPATPTPQQPTAAPELTPGVPGFLYAEQEPSVTGVVVREGETANVFGIKFRAENGAVKVTSIILRWGSTNPAAPHRILSKVEVVDEAGNVLASKSASDFVVDSSLNYYLPVTGLNFVVPANNYKSLFVRVTTVGTLPSVQGGWQQTITFDVQSSDVRGVDGTGAVISSSSGNLSLSFSVDTTVAGAAYFIAGIDPSSPREGYVFASDLVNGKAQNVPALVFNLTAKNDNLRVTKMSGSVSNTSTVERVRVTVGNATVIQAPASDGSWTVNLVPYNVVINRDQSQKVTVAVDLTNASVTPATFTVSVATTTAQNSLGDTKDYSTKATSQTLSYVKGGPTFVVNSKSLVLKAKKDSGNNIVTTTIDTISYNISVTANGTDVYIPASSPVYVEVVKADNTVVATTTLNVVNVNPVNTELVGSRYRVPAGNTVSFEVTAIPNSDHAGNLTLRAWVKSINWGYDDSSPVNTATFMASDMATWATNLVSPQ